MRPSPTQLCPHLAGHPRDRGSQPGCSQRAQQAQASKDPHLSCSGCGGLQSTAQAAGELGEGDTQSSLVGFLEPRALAPHPAQPITQPSDSTPSQSVGSLES